MRVFFNKTYIVYKENLPVTGRVLEEKNANIFIMLISSSRLFFYTLYLHFLSVHQSTTIIRLIDMSRI